uniref:Domain of unknown function DB domain-containing protein n=1 Tax=Panagrolaimus davidi TaxID=227884 RepID=A0A914QCE7_9BILA
MKAAVLCLFVLVVGVVFVDMIDIYDQAFLKCCKEKGIRRSCQPYCSYEKKADVVLKAFKAGKCDFDTEGPSYYQCLENEKDNRRCCKNEGVGADASLKYCLDKCDGTKPIKPDHKYFNCKPYAQKIRDCGEFSHYLR